MLDELLNEINELKEYKKKYESQKKDKKRMSDRLYELELAEYNSKTIEENKKEFINELCKDCRFKGGECMNELPDNILKPMPSKNEFFPLRVGCKNFEWN